MRRASMVLALLGAATLSIPAAASAAPQVTLKAKIVPIPKNLSKAGGPTWPGTGNILGAPAAIEGTFTIKGSEYPTASEGFTEGTELNVGPAPLRRVEVYLPKGTTISTKGFPTCALSKFENHLEPPCPKGSEAGPPGEANGKVFFGKTAVAEKVLVQAYFAPGNNKATFWIEGKTPASIEKYATGEVATIPGPFSKKLTSNVPLVRNHQRRPRRDGRTDQGHSWGGDHEGQKTDLRRPCAEDLPEGRLLRQGGTLVRRRRRIDLAESDCDHKGALPEELGRQHTQA